MVAWFAEAQAGRGHNHTGKGREAFPICRSRENGNPPNCLALSGSLITPTCQHHPNCVICVREQNFINESIVSDGFLLSQERRRRFGAHGYWSCFEIRASDFRFASEVLHGWFLQRLQVAGVVVLHQAPASPFERESGNRRRIMLYCPEVAIVQPE